MARLDKLDTIDSVVTKLDDLQATVQNISLTVTQLQDTVKTNSTDITEIKLDLANFKQETIHEVRSLKHTLNLREQQLRSSNVRIFNFPVAHNEANGLAGHLYDRILRPLFVEAYAAGDVDAIPLFRECVDSCYRVFSPGELEAGQSPPPILVKFVNKKFKIAALKHRKKHMPEPSVGEKKNGVKRFVMVEDLTPPGHKLLKALQADDRTEKVWSVNGQIHYSIPGKTGYKKVRSVFDTVDFILS